MWTSVVKIKERKIEERERELNDIQSPLDMESSEQSHLYLMQGNCKPRLEQPLQFPDSKGYSDDF